MRKVITLLLLVTSAVLVHAQYLDDVFGNCEYIPPKQANTWYFYFKAGLEFNREVNSLSNTVLDDGFTKTAVSVLCDENGYLLLFSDGEKVWNSGFQELTYAWEGRLLGSNDCSQSSIFIPSPDPNSPKCFLFTTDAFHYDIDQGKWRTEGLRYSIINIETDSVFPNTLLRSSVTEKLTGTRHANGVDFWAIAHGFDGGEADAFFAYRITAGGVDSIPRTSHKGSKHESPIEDQNSVGYMKASPDGSKLALAIYGQGKVELFDFNTSTGEVGSNYNFSSPEVEDAFCVEFSPDGSRLYVSTYAQSQETSYVFQYDLSSLPGNPLSQNEIISQSDTSVYTGMQLGPDGKIYISSISTDGQTEYKFLSVIENPNRWGADCNFREVGIYLAGDGKAFRGLVNVNQTFVDIPHFTYLHHCAGDSTALEIWNKSNINSALWDFGNDSTSTEMVPSFIFPSSGTFQVSVTEYFNGNSFTNSEPVVIFPLPVIDIGSGEDTIYKYPGSNFKLDAGPGFDYYYWNGSDQPGGQTFIANDTGLFYVMVVDSNCCYNIDRVWLYESQIIIPNAFTPNGDGHNDSFKPLILTEGVTNFSMLIYNRWGQLIFEIKDYTSGWDGNVKGKPAPLGVYIYVISYKVRVGIDAFKSEVQKGHLTLLR